MTTRTARRAAGFTLLEVMIALGVLAIGATTALALLVAATATGRRAEHHVDAALIADSVIAEISGDLTLDWKPDKLEVAEAPPDAQDGAGSTLRPTTKTRPSPSPRPNAGGSAKPSGGGAAVKDAADLREAGPARSLWLRRNRVHPSYPDYKYDVAITPCGGPPDAPWEFFVEVFVRWAEKGARRQAIYETVLLRRVVHLDNELPPR